MIEQYLQHYISYEQNHWDKFLPMAQFAFNNAEHLMIKVLPFYINYRYHPLLYGQPQRNNSVSEVVE